MLKLMPRRLTLPMAAAGLAAAVLATAFTGPAANARSAPQPVTAVGFTVRGHEILRDGQPWAPYGFSVYTFGNGLLSAAPDEYATVTAQLRAIAGVWHGNVVRLQVEQDEFLSGGDGQSAATFRARVFAAVSYAESLHLAVVINGTTEATDGIFTRNEPLPTTATLAFWRAMGRYRNDPAVILDPFNEPRYGVSGRNPSGDWGTWFYGGHGYLGENQLIRGLRGMGWHGQVWAEAPGNLALARLGVTWPKYRLSDPAHDLVYSYHHVSVDQNADPSVTQWNVEFGNLVTRRGLPVVDGEWTNRSVPYGTEGHVFSPSGDTGQCWGHAPKFVPLYLSYLAARSVGMTVWTLGPVPDYVHYDAINPDGDNSNFTMANDYSNWHGCVTPKGQRTSGAGQLLMAWFAQQDRYTG